MSYLLDKNRRRKKYLAALSGVLFLAIMFYFRALIWSGLSYAAGKTFQPVLILGNDIGGKFRSLGAYAVSKKSLRAQNEALLLKLEEDRAKMLNYDLLTRENQNLKEVLGRKKDEQKLILAAILSKPNESAYDTLLVDAGENEGIKTGDMVFALGDIPVGRVGATTPNTSKIILFSSESEKTQVVIGGNSSGAGGNVFYELTGRGGGNFEMILPRDMVLQKSDQVVLPGLYPLVLAEVETAISDPRDPFTKVLLTSPVNIQEIKFVQIKK